MTETTETMMTMTADLIGGIARETAVGMAAALVIGKSLFTDLTVQAANRT
jgi:hypothetical protein